MQQNQYNPFRFRLSVFLTAFAISAVCVLGYLLSREGQQSIADESALQPTLDFKPRHLLDTSGYGLVTGSLKPSNPGASLEEVAAPWQRVGYRGIEAMDIKLTNPLLNDFEKVNSLLMKAAYANYEGEPKLAYKTLQELRKLVLSETRMTEDLLYSVIYWQGVAALRQGETENCVLCRGESSCILPITKAAIHTHSEGSKLAIQHFTEYLNRFPDDLEVRWLLNIAHMTLGEHPDKVDPRYLILLDYYRNTEFDIGKFRDVGHLAGINRLNQAGGAIIEDFDNDGLLDIVVSTTDATQAMAFYRNNGVGTFEERTGPAGLSKQIGGGLNCVQTDYNNDGFMDVFVIRGAWLSSPVRPSLLRNNGDGTFTDVTEQAGLSAPMNSNAAIWADYDNDGFVDVFICGEKQPSRLYHNNGDGTFTEVAAQAGLVAKGYLTKGANWIDFDNDGYPDLFINNNEANNAAELYHNNRDGTFTEVTQAMGIDGPMSGFSCWAFDFDNDGWLDIFATCYQRTVSDIVKGLIGEPHSCEISRLYRNLGGKGFQDVTKEYGLDKVYSTMGSNFGDFDGDGYLDFYLGTGEPELGALTPNRMFKNVAGKRFSEVTGSSGTGHLQKGHGVACGDLRRNGNIDILIEMGGAVNGDKYHNILFQNPGHGNNWLTVKLVGKKTNRAALGARIKVVTTGEKPLTVHRHVTSGSSFGANPLQQSIGLAKHDRVATLEIYWPTSKTTQVFHDVDVNQALEITEFASEYRKLNWKPIPELK
jgi:hypothetical protein